MKKKITNFEMSYVERIHYLPNYGEDDNGDNIDVLCIPCQKTPSDKPPVRLKNELNEEGEKIKEEENLYKRVDESDVLVLKKDEPAFLMDKQRIWAKREYHLDSDKDEGRTYSTDN